MEELHRFLSEGNSFLGSLAHELKTPMTSIIGYSDTLLHVRINEEQQKKALTHINNECRRLERLSGKMMNLLGALQQRDDPYGEASGQPADRKSGGA